MNWQKLFASHILERGYDYYCDGAVENIEIGRDDIRADVVGTEDYEVEISLNDGKVTDMYCSCPYAAGGNNCKHMAAVLYEWTADIMDEDEPEDTDNEDMDNDADAESMDLFEPAVTVCDYKKKSAAVEKLVTSAERDIVQAFLVSVLAEDKKLLLRFRNMVNKCATKEDVEDYFEQIDEIADRYLGRDHFINYYQAYDFMLELEEIIDKDVRRMIDNGSHISAFHVMNHIFVLLGNVDMDDSGGETSMLAEQIYQLWLELLTKVNAQDKRKMFIWFTTHMDGSVIDYLEEYIEQIIMEEFKEPEYEQDKLSFMEEMIEKAEKKDSGWSRDYAVGKWTVTYLKTLEEKNAPEDQLEEICKKYWNNSGVRRYYIDRYFEKKEYDRVLQVLDESIELDKAYRGQVLEYNQKKKEIYRLQGNKSAYIEQLWKLVLEQSAGDLDIYKELKAQYSEKEWLIKREELFKKLPPNAHIDRLYKEEKLYDRLLAYVLKSSGLYAVQSYENVLKKEYPKQILSKYQGEVNKMASCTGNRKHYADLVALLRRMKRIKGGSEIVETIVEEWKIKYRNRPAMMDELSKL
ncbi:SWIM zinc finger family protein [Roseburia faecis]|uniref:SWIM zinc finger family protein n=1 Tax=Roseburia faecis TaxID=301302 RepID=UPI001D022F40|nr:SWIM zinc finger family protein [Roseburia faecis]MCB5479093.1 SWIM zinc finger family protein [Roseburia faecis]